MNMNKFYFKKESFIFSKNRKDSTKSFLSSLFSIVSALVVALLVATMFGYNPFQIFAGLFSIGFNEPWSLFYYIGVYALAGFAFYFAWKAKIINIGISGQMLAAGSTIVIISNSFSDIPNWVGYGVGQLFMLIIAIAISSSIAMLVGALQIYLKVNAVVSSILLNWIIYFISFFILATYYPSEESLNGGVLANSATIDQNFAFFDPISNSGTGPIIPVVVILLVISIVLFIVFKYTVFGYKIKSIGLSESASTFAGYNIKKIKLSIFAISGVISGILACICYSSINPACIPLSITVNAIPNEGFNGIMVALVGNSNPIGIILVSILFGLFNASSIGLSTDPSFNNVILGFVMLGSSLSVLFIKWKPWVRLNKFKYDSNFEKTQSIFDNKIDNLISTYELNLINLKYQKNISKEEFNIKLIELIEQYKLDKQILIDEYKTNKIKNIIYSKLLTSDLISKKSSKISTYYNEYLTKKVNKVKQKISKYELDLKLCEQNNLEDKYKQIISLKIDSLKNDIEIMIEKNSIWKENEINKLIKKQNKYINNDELLNKVISEINLKTEKIELQENKDSINKLLNEFNNLNKKGE